MSLANELRTFLRGNPDQYAAYVVESIQMDTRVRATNLKVTLAGADLLRQQDRLIREAKGRRRSSR